MFKFIKKYWPQLILFLVVSFLCWRNFTPGTFLSGWDNLHPEFNILANIKRSLFSTWQEYQGLGLLAGMAHASDLVRQLIILPFTLFLPLNLIRYLWHFSMLFLGSFGIFSLVIYITKNRISALISSLFYLLNFGTVQYFYLAFDPYSTFWGFFPWLMYFLWEYLNSIKYGQDNVLSLQKLKKLIFINILATPSFYVQTLFLVYLICLSLILIIWLIDQISARSHNAKSMVCLSASGGSTANLIFSQLKIIFIILLINSFWLLPNIYFTLTRVSVTQNSIQNQIVTDQFIEQNIYRGNIKSFGLLQGQYYDLKTSESKNTQFLMAIWHQHLSSPLIQFFSYFIILISLIGIFSKNKYKKYFLALLFFSLIAFLSDTPPFNFLNNLFHHLPLLNQIFRNSFTKLLVPTVFSLSILLALSTTTILKKISFIIPLLIIIISWPSFLGNFISPTIRSHIPEKYFQLFNYLKTQDSSKRILNLPQYNFWGWYDYNWNYTGSGFIWYGINQAITDRTFDVWDNNLENLYWQLHYTLLSQNSEYFDQLLEKYNISYVLLDRNIFFNEAANSGKVIFANENLVNFSKKLTLEKEFDNLKLYSVDKPNHNLTLFNNLPNIKSSLLSAYLDHPFLNYSHYKNDPEKSYLDTFPFNSIFTNYPNLPLKIKDNILFSDLDNYQVPLNLSWTPCTTNTSSTISATNQERVSFYNCGSELNFDQGYLIKINSQNIAGRPLGIKVFSQSNNRLIIDTKLQNSDNLNYLVIPPIYSFDSGLGINVASLSFSDNPSINTISDISISPLDWTNITNLHFNQTTSKPISINPSFSQYNQTLYSISLLDTKSSNQLVLFQSYSPDWLAFYFDNFKINFLPHHLVDNWANGWDIPDNICDTDRTLSCPYIYIFFWPQLLEFFGFGLLIGTIFWVLKNSSDSQ